MKDNQNDQQDSKTPTGQTQNQGSQQNDGTRDRQQNSDSRDRQQNGGNQDRQQNGGNQDWQQNGGNQDRQQNNDSRDRQQNDSSRQRSEDSSAGKGSTAQQDETSQQEWDRKAKTIYAGDDTNLEDDGDKQNKSKNQQRDATEYPND